MISFHKAKEQAAEKAYEEQKRHLELDGNAESAAKLKKLKIVKPLMTIMGV